jgi:hypothetical protein
METTLFYLVYPQNVDRCSARDMPKAIRGVDVLKWLVMAGFSSRAFYVCSQKEPVDSQNGMSLL